MEEQTKIPLMVAPQGGVVTPMQMLNIAVSQGADLDRLEKLMALQERWEANESRRAFSAALGRFKMKGIVIGKDARVSYKKKDNSVTDYRHASLGNIAAVLSEELGREGLAFRWHTAQENGKIRVTCILSHEMGHSESVTLESSPDDSGGKNAIQAIGSTTSYLQRYTVLAVTGTATSEHDDDGRGSEPEGREVKAGKTAEKSAPAVEYISAERFEELCTDKLDNDTGEITKMGWKSLVLSGTKSAEDLIAWATARGNLTESQQKTIFEWKGN